MEKKIYILICQEDGAEIVSVKASNNIEALRARMVDEWNTQVDDYLDAGYKNAEDEDVSWCNENHAVAGTSNDGEGLYYSWDIKAVDVI